MSELKIIYNNILQELIKTNQPTGICIIAGNILNRNEYKIFKKHFITQFPRKRILFKNINSKFINEITCSSITTGEFWFPLTFEGRLIRIEFIKHIISNL